jgi:hypothetical protein
MTNKIEQRTIWLVIEQGVGFIHHAFTLYSDALEFAENLKKETGFDCYELHELDLK